MNSFTRQFSLNVFSLLTGEGHDPDSGPVVAPLAVGVGGPQPQPREDARHQGQHQTNDAEGGAAHDVGCQGEQNHI